MKEYHADPSSFEQTLRLLDELPASEDVTIHMAGGIYRGPIEIHKHYLTLIGPEDCSAIFSGDLAGAVILDDGERRGTFRSQTVFVDADHFKACNITFANEAGPGEIAAQALALYSDGDDLTYDHCRFLGFQDTLFTAPLPPQELQSGGFRGPKEFSPRRSGRQAYHHCYIEGTVDFIFGGGVCYFKDCDIFSRHRPEHKVGYVTAASTPEKQAYGYVFDSCRFIGDAEPGSVYLGRPWRDYAHVVVMNSYLSAVIHPDHWHDWNKPQAHDTIKYFEYNNSGPGARTDIKWARFLTREEAVRYTEDVVLRDVPMTF